MEKASKAITFLGAVLTTIACIVLSVTSLVSSPIWIVISVPIIVLVWVGRYNAVTKRKMSWSIIMLILTGLWGYFWTLFGMIELFGYLINTIYLNSERDIY